MIMNHAFSKSPIEKMRFMFFVDYDNFKPCFIDLTKGYPNFKKIPLFLFQKINTFLSWDKYSPRLIRTYVYSGEYYRGTGIRIKNKLKLVKNHKHKEKDVKGFLERIHKEKEIQEYCFKRFVNFPFVELKLKPLQFSPRELKLFQKGTDVQLAVDLVHHAYGDNFDVAVVCSGDVDLLESIKLVKSLGKKVVLVAHPGSIAYDMKKECDFFYNLAKINSEELKTLCFKVPNLEN